MNLQVTTNRLESWRLLNDPAQTQQPGMEELLSVLQATMLPSDIQTTSRLGSMFQCLHHSASTIKSHDKDYRGCITSSSSADARLKL